jgi:hypothetical protein
VLLQNHVVSYNSNNATHLRGNNAMTSTPPGQPRRAGTETGALPRIDIEPEIQHEPPQPPYLPEIDGDPGSVTGIIPLISEGEDTAKQSDDSATASEGV